MGHEWLVRLVRPMNTTDRILGEAKRKVRPPTEKEQTDPLNAYYYAKDVIGGRFPEGEAAIATDPRWAHEYARDVIGGRWPEGEAAIATGPDPYYTLAYLGLFPEAKLEWAMNGWLDWLDL
jgi:hypothetical protein